ncbi:MAG: CaiB/BaiF CoA transferase family protein [Acidimicrobiales bacterium]
MTSGPLSGLEVLELAGIGACPFAAMVLADLGADVLRVERAEAVPDEVPADAAWDLLQRGKRSIGVNLKEPAGVALVLDLVSRADVLVEGFRPGVTERLGLGPTECHEVNARLVYGRMTGFGQKGPLAASAGHDIDYIALSGVLGLIGREGERPLPPINLVGDFGGGGMVLALGVVSALWSASRTGCGQVVDASMVDGAALLATMMWSFRHSGVWSDRRGTNLLDTGAPFYEVYECADGRHVAVGALEPQFFKELLDLLGDQGGEPVVQNDRAWWREGKRLYAEVFRTRPRDEWVALAEGRDACIAPVLSAAEAETHPHNVARSTFVEVGGVVQPGPAPRFSATPAAVDRPPCWPGEGGADALGERGIEADRIRRLRAAGTLCVVDQRRATC